MPQTDTPVQPCDLLTKEEVDKLLNACAHPRDKALLSIALDGGMRIGAMGTMRLKGIEFTDHGALLYIIVFCEKY